MPQQTGWPPHKSDEHFQEFGAIPRLARHGHVAHMNQMEAIDSSNAKQGESWTRTARFGRDGEVQCVQKPNGLRYKLTSEALFPTCLSIESAHLDVAELDAARRHFLLEDCLGGE